MDRKKEAFRRLVEIMDELRAKCPWDRKQTMESLRHLTIEETYELSEAIITGNTADIKNELGDLMLHIVFYAKIASEQGDFDLTDVLNGICEKLIHRHPHVFGDTKAETAEQVKQNWEQLKLKEDRKSVLEGVPASLPPLVKALRIQDKVKSVGFDWEDARGPLEKIREEIAELHEELQKGTSVQRIEAEFGDLLFSVINYARFFGINPDSALEKTNMKFIRRFCDMEEQAASRNRNLADLSLEEMEELWQRAKSGE
ncbi:MAG: nucleoside triphosphate pyrophosphohydrolase [Flavobacteriales bacterium]